MTREEEIDAQVEFYLESDKNLADAIAKCTESQLVDLSRLLKRLVDYSHEPGANITQREGGIVMAIEKLMKIKAAEEV